MTWETQHGGGTLVLGPPIGEGGEGSVYEGRGSTVVKIFDKDHITRHRKEKVDLLMGHGLRMKGLCIPSAHVTNRHGEFVGYVMPKASGRVFQRTIFNKRKFQKEYPSWTKTDLVDICISFLEKVQYLHSMNVILGDINPKNLMIDDPLCGGNSKLNLRLKIGRSAVRPRPWPPHKHRRSHTRRTALFSTS